MRRGSERILLGPAGRLEMDPNQGVTVQIPLEITFSEMDRDPAIEAKVEEKAAGLEKYYGRITSCRVVVKAPHRHHHTGNLYHVRIDITVPRGEIIVNREPTRQKAHSDINVAIRDAFSAARRRLQDFVRKQRGDTKVHTMPPQPRAPKRTPKVL